MNLSPGDSNNKSIIFTCGLGFLSGSVCARAGVCAHVHVCQVLRALAWHPPASPDALQGGDDWFESCQPGVAVSSGMGTWHLCLVQNFPASLLLAVPSLVILPKHP